MRLPPLEKPLDELRGKSNSLLVPFRASEGFEKVMFGEIMLENTLPKAK